MDHKIAPLPPPARVTAKEGGGGILGGVDVGKVGKGLVLVTFSVPVNVDGYASSEYVGLYFFVFCFLFFVCFLLLFYLCYYPF